MAKEVMIETELIGTLINAGIGGAIASLIIYLIYKLVSRLALDVGMKMVHAFESQADAITRQAQSMEILTESIKDFVGRDGSEHREMLVLLRFIAQQQQIFEEVRSEHINRKEQAHPYCPVKSSKD